MFEEPCNGLFGVSMCIRNACNSLCALRVRVGFSTFEEPLMEPISVQHWSTKEPIMEPIMEPSKKVPYGCHNGPIMSLIMESILEPRMVPIVGPTMGPTTPQIGI